MAALVVRSRFAGLKIEDDEYPSTSDAPNTKKATKANAPKKSEPAKKSKNTTNTKPQAQPPQRKKKTKPETPSDQQWEIWKQKDEEINEGHFENELQEAIMLSKLDFEEKKDVYKKTKKEADNEKKSQEQKNGKKQKKKNVMSLDQFNDMVNGVDDWKLNHIDEKNPAPCVKAPIPKDTEFFERVENEAKNEILKEDIIDRVKNRQAAPDEVFTRVQFTEALERKNEEIESLKKEIATLKEALLTVKSRNKKLCNILGQAEMKDKAEVLIEVERLRSAQVDLTAEISALHSDLERERSKNTDPRAKDKKYNSTRKKNIRFDVSSEAILSKESSSGTG